MAFYHQPYYMIGNDMLSEIFFAFIVICLPRFFLSFKTEK